MKTLAIITVALAILSATTQVHAGGRGRASGYSYRNPYAASPSVGVRGYMKSSGTVVMPHYRTPGNYKITDNLSYRGYGTIRSPR